MYMVIDLCEEDGKIEFLRTFLVNPVSHIVLALLLLARRCFSCFKHQIVSYLLLLDVRRINIDIFFLYLLQQFSSRVFLSILNNFFLEPTSLDRVPQITKVRRLLQKG